jgi:hypothetical protein
VGRAFDYELRRRYGLENAFEGQVERINQRAHYVVSYAFMPRPAYLGADSTDHFFGRLRVSVQEGAGMPPKGLEQRRLKRKGPRSPEGLSQILSRRRPTFPHSCPRSIIGDERLNCRVRNGNGCDPLSMTTGNLISVFR